jgi:hypothetical protein
MPKEGKKNATALAAAREGQNNQGLEKQPNQKPKASKNALDTKNISEHARTPHNNQNGKNRKQKRKICIVGQF